MSSFLADCKHVRISTKTGESLDVLKSELTKSLEKAYAIPSDDLVLTSTRHTDALSRTLASLTSALSNLKSQVSNSQFPAELLAAHLRDALESLGEILGRTDNEAMLDQLFAKFCIGK